MKRYFIPAIVTVGMSLGLASCDIESIDELSGVYPAPVEAVMTSLTGSTVEKGDGTRNFTIDLAGSGANLHAVLVGNKYFLPANTYTIAAAGTAKNGNYVSGLTTVGGKTVTSGSLIVNKSGEANSYSPSDVYTFDGMLFCSDGTVYNVSWSGNLAYEPDPEPVKLTQVFQAQSNLANGVASVTLSLASDGVGSYYDAATWSTVYTGDGNYLAVDLYSADGYLHEGTYTASAQGGVIGEGEFGIGWDPGDLYGWGISFTNWGTCWWTVSGGATSAEKITSGTITVTKSGNKWKIEWGSESTYPNWATFSGAIEALTPAGGDTYDGTTLTQNFGITDYTGWGMSMVGIELGTDGVICTPGGWGNTYSGDGNYLKLEIYSTDGKIAPGTYKASTTGGVIGEGEFGIGYDGDYGASGTTWYTLAGGESSYQYITDGTVTVEVDGDDYKITIESSVINARYGFSDGGDGGSDDFDGVTLSQFGGLTDYTGWGMTFIGIDLATEGVTITPGGWGNTYGGNGNYLKLEVYSTDGTLAAGTYTACAEGGNIGEGQFGIGYDGAYGASGTCWYPVDGEAGTPEYVTDGTLTVEVDGDTYTIILESSVVNAKYVGKLSAE